MSGARGSLSHLLLGPSQRINNRKALSERRWFNRGGRFTTVASYHMFPVALLQTPKSRLTDTCTPIHASLTGPHPGIAGPTGGR